MDKLLLLKKAGLNERESETYLALLSKFPATVAEIAKSWNLHRPDVYRALPSLMESGLVTAHPKGKRTLYVPESPRKLERLYEESKLWFSAMVEELDSEFSRSVDRPTLRHYEGQKGIHEVLYDIVERVPKGGEYLRFSSRKQIPWSAPPPLQERYVKLRDEKNLSRLVITNEKSVASKKQRPNRELAAIPDSFGSFDDDVTKIIYADRVAIIDYASKTAFTIESAPLARLEEKIFRMMFRYLRRDGQDETSVRERFRRAGGDAAQP